VVVVVEAGTAGVVTVDCSDVVVVLTGAGPPQPANTAAPAISATPAVSRKRDVEFIV
jgi:hypothetical protein